MTVWIETTSRPESQMLELTLARSPGDEHARTAVLGTKDALSLYQSVGDHLWSLAGPPPDIALTVAESTIVEAVGAALNVLPASQRRLFAVALRNGISQAPRVREKLSAILEKGSAAGIHGHM